MATGNDLLASISKDADLITWSLKNNVHMIYCDENDEYNLFFRPCMAECSSLVRLTVSAFTPQRSCLGWSQGQSWYS